MATATATKARKKKTPNKGSNGGDGTGGDGTGGEKKKKERPKREHVGIPAPNMKVASFEIVGDAPYVQSKFSEKALLEMRRTQELGSVSRKGRKKDPKDFDALFRGAVHRTEEGWAGIPANGIRAACVSACRTVGFKMTLAKLSLFIEADGFDATDGTPLVRITKGDPRHVEHSVRIQNTTDIRVRAMWDPGWRATVRVRYDGDQFNLEDVSNLLMRVGMQVGLGEGRPDSRSSSGMGWGTFQLAGK